MSTSPDFVAYVCEQIEGIGNVRSRKMFGEYMIYINEKPVLLVCDNTVFVKMLPELECLLSDAPTGYPYDGAKLHYILDIDDALLCRDVISVAEQLIAIPKKKR